MTADVLTKALTRHLPNTSLGTSIKSFHSVLDFRSFTRLLCSQPISPKSLLILILHFFLIFQGAAFQERFLIHIVIHFCIYVYHINLKYCLIMYFLFRHVHIPADCPVKLHCLSVHLSITWLSLKIFMIFLVEEFYKQTNKCHVISLLVQFIQF